MDDIENITYYEILGVKPSDDMVTIKNAWRKLCLKYHPDVAKDKELAEKMIRKINEAYEVLSDEKKRNIYNKYGKKGLQEETQYGKNPLAQMFIRKQQNIVPPIEVVIQLSLDKLYMGTTVNQEFQRKDICKSCNKTGSKDKKKHPCGTCKGRGNITQLIQQGPFIQQVNTKCPDCKGTRIQAGTPLCTQCNGYLFVLKNSLINYEIPPGYFNGANIEISNVGHEIPPEYNIPNRTRGDVILIIQEIPHDIFKRIKTNPSDLAIILEISLEEALCGFIRTICHLDGRKLAIVEHGDITSGQIKVIKGEGMPKKSNPLLKGNLIIKFIITFPKNLTKNQKKIIYECLNGGSFDDVDLSIPSDHVMTYMLPFSEDDILEEDEQSQQQECHIQ